MTQNRNLDYGQRLPEAVLDAIQELLGTYVSANFRLTKQSSTTLQVVAGTDNDQVGLSIDGRWRYITSSVNATHPGGSAGTYDVYVTGSDNNFVAGTPETDLTVYAFGLVIRATGSPPATALYRKVGAIAWDGAQITAVQPLFGDLGSAIVSVPDSQIRNRVTTTASITNALTAMRAGDAQDRMVLTETGLSYGPGSGAQDVAFSRDATGPRWTSTVPVNATGFQVSGTPLAAAHLSNGITGTAGTAVVLAGGSPAFLGTPTAPTAAAGTNTTQLATTAFVLGQGANTNPVMDGTVAQGVSDRYARQDHVHPSDTSRAPLSSPALTGTPTSPTAAVDTATTQIATTAFVVNQGYLKAASTGITPSQINALAWVEGVSASALPNAAGAIQSDPQLAMKITLNAGWVLNVAAGHIAVQGDDNNQQGLYWATQAAATVTMVTHQPATNPRWDLIIARYNDAAFTGRTPVGLGYEVIVGSENAAAALGNYAGIASLPVSSVELARVLVRVSDTTGPISGNIVDSRKLAGPAVWGEDGHRYRLGVDGSGIFGAELVV
jgi:hypothetical protein